MEAGLQGQCASHLAVQDGTDCSGFDKSPILSKAGLNLWAQRSGSDIQTALIMSVVLMLLIIMTVHWYFLEQKRRKLLPPGPRPYPIVGNIFDMSGRDGLAHRALRSLAAKFGGLMYLRLGSQPCLVVSTVAVAKEIFQAHDVDFLSRPQTLFWAFSPGSMVGAHDGPYWRHLRKLCNMELFSHKRQVLYEGIRAEEFHDMMRGILEDSKKGTPLTLPPRLYGMAANNLTRMAINKRYFGANSVTDEQEKQDLERLSDRHISLVTQFVISDYVPWLSFVPRLQGINSAFKEFSQFRKGVTDAIFEVERHRERAKERRRQQHRHSEDGNPNDLPDFVELLLASPRDDGEPLSDREIISCLTDMIVGVTDTTSRTIEWAMAELVLQPDVMKQAQKELDTVVGTKRLVQESDIPNLPYLQAITKEVFRMHPVVPLSVPHVSTRACEVLGFKIPSGTRIIFNIFAIQSDPSVYESPNTFNVNRFMVDRHRNVDATAPFNSYELMPFGAGRRMCPAYAFGYEVVTMVIAHFLHSFNWTLPEGCQSAQGVDMTEIFGIVMSMKTPLSLVATPRSPAFLY